MEAVQLDPPATDPYASLRPQTKVWTVAHCPLGDAEVFFLGAFDRADGTKHALRALISIDWHSFEDGVWLHISLSHRKRLPTVLELAAARDELGYGDRAFIQIVPPRGSYQHRHALEYTVHAYSRIDGVTVPAVLLGQRTH